MTPTPAPPPATADTTAWRAVADWYHAAFTGLILSVVTRRGPAEAARFVEAVFARQREERFLPGLAKLGLDRLPHAVAAAQYHYLSNHIGGVAVEYMPESDRKAWVRYPPPRWIWAGTALCAIPPEVSAAMMKGWHARNGETLGNPRLGFVCTKQAADGDAGLEGYYYEYDHDLAPHERLRFAKNEDAPDFDPGLAPVLESATWPELRLAKAYRNYAMEYLRTAWPVALALWGADTAVPLLRLSARMVGMQCYHDTARKLGLLPDKTATGFAAFMACLAGAQGDHCETATNREAVHVRQQGWALMRALPDVDIALAPVWNGLLEGALMAHHHRLALGFAVRHDAAGIRLEWRIT